MFGIREWEMPLLSYVGFQQYRRSIDLMRGQDGDDDDG